MLDAFYRLRRSNNNRRMNSRLLRPPLSRPILGIEPLEDRRMLSVSVRQHCEIPYSDVGSGETVECASLNGVTQRETVDKGDYYWYFDEKIPLERLADEVVIKLAGSSRVDQAIAALTREGGVLDGLRFTETVKDRIVHLSGVSASGRSLDGLLSDLPIAPGIEWAVPAFAHTQASSPILVLNEFSVRLAPGVKAEEFFTGRFDDYRRSSGTLDTFVITVDAAGLDVLALANEYNFHPDVMWAEPNLSFKLDKLDHDPLYDEQWQFNNTGQTGGTSDADADIEAAWNVTTGSASVTIAVLDDGVQTNHPDLAANIWVNAGETSGNSLDDDGNGWVDDVNGYDFKNGDADPNPSHAFDNHGTAVAGIAAAAHNGVGVTGVSQSAKIMAVKIVEGGVFLASDEIADAVYYAAGRTEDAMGTWDAADIINASWGGGTPSTALTDAFDWAESNGVTTFAAAGNSASGYQDVVVGFGAGNFLLEWRYVKNGSVSSGDDTVWLRHVKFPDGSFEDFDSASLPAGWSTSGNANWSTVVDPLPGYLVSQRVAKAGSIGNNQNTRLRSPNFSGGGELRFRYLVSSESNDELQLWFSSNGGVSFTQFFSDSGVPSTTTAVAYPASLASTIAVGASTDFDFRSDYSQFGSALDFVAPSDGGAAGVTTTDRTGTDGRNTVSGSAGDYTDTEGSAFGGTSAAAPLAAGIGALLLSQDPSRTPAEIREIMQVSADVVGAVTYTGGTNTYYGHGRVNAHKALTLPEISISDVTVTQADSGSSSAASVFALFTVNLSGAYEELVTFVYSTQDGTASAGSDYVSDTGVGFILAGETSTTIAIEILPGTESSAETFIVEITFARESLIGDGIATAAIQPPQANVTIDHVGTTVTATGTPANDTLKFFHGDYYRVDVNGVKYFVDPFNVSAIVLKGGAGTDHAQLNDSPGDDTLTARVQDYASLTDGTYTATAQFFESAQAIAANGGSDHAIMYDTTTDDTFSGRPADWARIEKTNDTSKYVAATAFESVQGIASSGGTDKALIYDTNSDDNFSGQVNAANNTTWALMELASNGDIEVKASGFESAQGVASSGGTDHALIYDSTANDTFTARANAWAKMWLTNNSSIFVLASTFETALAVANSSGTDNAILYDTTSDDTMSGRVGEWGKMWVTSDSSKYVQASSFESVDGNFSSNGDDDAILYDTTGNDTFTGTGSTGTMTTSLSSATLRVLNMSDAADTVQIVSNLGGTDVTSILGSLLYFLIETGPWNV